VNGSDNNVDTLLFVIENTWLITEKMQVIALGDLFFMAGGVYWIGYEILSIEQESNATTTGFVLGGIVGGTIGAMVDSARNKGRAGIIKELGIT
jgi:hypothetical protein